MTAALTRRALIKALVASSLTLPVAGQTRPVFRENPFQLGVASGSPESDSVVLWTRLYSPAFSVDHSPGQTDIGKYAVQWEIALDPEFSQVFRTGVSGNA
jgi:alkaline phosphatase D